MTASVRVRSWAVAGAASALVLGLAPSVPASAASAADLVSVRSNLPGPGERGGAALAGKVIAIDPGHQLGNDRFPAQINALVNAGGFRKPCNTTGTATHGGYAEATFAFKVAKKLRRQLRARGARVIMTRTRNSRSLWGPCVDVRGKFGNKGFRGRARNADLKISIHADGSYSGGHGFHVIAPEKRAITTRSIRLARRTRAALSDRGFDRADYIAGGDGLDRRGDLATLNLSKPPVVMVELGNMRNKREAKVMRSRKGQLRYARGLRSGIARYLHR